MDFIVNGNNLTCLECIFYTDVLCIYKEINSYTYIVVYQQMSRAARKMQNVVILTPTRSWYVFCVHQTGEFESRVTRELHCKTSNLTVVLE